MDPEKAHDKFLKEHDYVLDYYYREPYYWWVNSFLRDGRPPSPTLTGRRAYPVDEQLILYIITEMDKMFERTPPITREIVVYKGIQLRNISELSKTPQYQSCSTDISVAISFLNDTKCCLLEIRLPIGTKALFTNNSNKEVILPRNIMFQLLNRGESEYVLDTSAGSIDIYSAIAVNTGHLSTIKSLIQGRQENEKKIRLAMKELANRKSDMEKLRENASEYKFIYDNSLFDDWLTFLKNSKTKLEGWTEDELKNIFDTSDSLS